MIQVVRIGFVSCALAGSAIGELPSGYVETGRYDHPFDAFDVRQDGRLIGLVGENIVLQDEVNGGTYTTLGSISPGFIAPFGASFVSVSPDGTRLAIGDNSFGAAGEAFVGIFDISGGAALAVAEAPNFSGAWADNQTLMVAGGTLSASNIVTRIDAMTGISVTVMDDMAGFSGAVASDGARLFVGNGFATGGVGDSQTGEVRSFAVSSLTGMPTLSYEADGVFAGRALSAGSLDIDEHGNLIVGGGDLFGGSGDFGTIAVLDGLGGRVDIASPFGADTNLAQFNGVTHEILVYAGTGEIVRFAAIPGPSAIMGLSLGLVCGRRRRA